MGISEWNLASYLRQMVTALERIATAMEAPSSAGVDIERLVSVGERNQAILEQTNARSLQHENECRAQWAMMQKRIEAALQRVEQVQ